MLVNQNGVRFGTGSDAKGAFWVNIEVTQAKNVFYNFVSDACKASWSSNAAGTLSCPGKTKDEIISVMLSLKVSHLVRMALKKMELVVNYPT